MLDDDYSKPPRNPVFYGMISLFTGVAATGIAFYLTDYLILAIILGAVGMVIGGFSISIASHFPTKEKYQYMWFAIAGVMASVIGFLVGFVNFLS